jgi:hypothetical protein
VELPENIGLSYTLADAAEEPELPAAMQEQKQAETAAIATVTPITPAPPRKKRKKKGPGFWASLAAIASKATCRPQDDAWQDRHAPPRSAIETAQERGATTI